MENNPLLKILKENDIVMMEVPSRERNTYKQICRIYNLKFIPPDEKCRYDWLDFAAEVLYTNFRMHKTMTAIGNCFAITEIIPQELVETYVRQNEMWKRDQYPLSDIEYEAKVNYIKSIFVI